MVDNDYGENNLQTPEFITSAAQHICKEHGIGKAVEFLGWATSGLNPVQLFSVCEGKAELEKDREGNINVRWLESETDSAEDSDT